MTDREERTLVLDPQDEIIAACCKALDKAHSLLDVIARYEGKVQTPEFVAACKAWVDGEYDPGTRTASAAAAGKDPEVFIHVTPKCEHEFAGWREFEDGNGGEQVCTKCGIGAMAASLRDGP